MITVAGDGCKHFLSGVVAQVCERWEVCWYKTTTVTSANEHCKTLAVGCTRRYPPPAERSNILNPLIATLKPQSNGPSYSNTMIGTLGGCYIR